MRILEIKNSLVKISYEVEENLALAGFVIIEDKNTPYVAQVVNLKAENSRNYAVLKLLFTFNDEGVLKPYDGTIPSVSANVTSLPSVELLAIMPVENPVYLGTLAHQNISLKLDATAFQSNMLICSNSVENSSKILSNILPQLVEMGEKVVLIDVNGDFSSDENFIFGRNFKLPLTSKFIDYIFENELGDVEPVSKAIIQDIFKEVQGYIDTLPQGFIPIDTFINVVQGQYEETRIAELVLLQNKLLKYQENNIFMTSADDSSMFRSKVAHTDSLIVDVSNVEVSLQKLLIPYMFDCISTVNRNTFVLISMNNDVADKRLLRRMLEFSNIFTTIICPHEFRYLPDLKQIIQNMIMFAPQTLQHDFANYNTFLAKLNADEFIVYGSATQQIPFIVQSVPYDELVESEEEVVNTDEQNVEEEMLGVNLEENSSVIEVAVEEQEVVLESSVINNENEEEQLSYEEISVDEVAEGFDNGQDDVEEVITSVPDYIEDDVEEIGLDDVINQDFTENEGLSSWDNSEEDSVFPFQEDDTDLSDAYQESTFEQEIEQNREELVEQVAQDVDAAFYRKLDEDTVESEDDVAPEIFLDDEEAEELSESDLDFIQSMPMSISDDTENYSVEEINGYVEPNETFVFGEEVSSEDGMEEFSVDNSEMFVDESDDNDEISQMVPIYTPEEFSQDVAVNVPVFDAGDVVSHPKYGQGVVEKMINYGNKTLCSISFVNIGRRLLDPSLSELRLVSRDGAILNN